MLAKKILLCFCSNEGTALSRLILKEEHSETVFQRIAVTLVLWGLGFTSLHQRSSRACNAEGIVSAGKGFKQS